MDPTGFSLVVSTVLLLINLVLAALMMKRIIIQSHQMMIYAWVILGCSSVWQLAKWLSILYHEQNQYDTYVLFATMDTISVVLLMPLHVVFQTQVLLAFSTLSTWIHEKSILWIRMGAVLAFTITFSPIFFSKWYYYGIEPEWMQTYRPIAYSIMPSYLLIYEYLHSIFVLKYLSQLSKFDKNKSAAKQASIQSLRRYTLLMLLIDGIGLALFIYQQLMPVRFSNMVVMLDHLSTDSVGFHVVFIIIFNSQLRHIQFPGQTSSEDTLARYESEQSLAPEAPPNSLVAMQPLPVLQLNFEHFDALRNRGGSRENSPCSPAQVV